MVAWSGVQNADLFVGGPLAAATVYKGDLYISWAVDSRLYFARHYMYRGSNWLALKEAATPRSSAVPALVEYRGVLYVIHRGMSSEARIWYSTFDGTHWSEDHVLDDFPTLDAPSAVLSGDLLEVYYVGTDHYIRWLTFNGSKWARSYRLPMRSACGPAAAFYNDKMYVVYRGDTDDSLHYFTIYGALSDDKLIPGTHKTDRAPTAVVYDGKLHVFHHSNDNSNRDLYHLSFDGKTWTDSEKLALEGDIPGCAVLENTLYVLGFRIESVDVLGVQLPLPKLTYVTGT